MTTEKKQEILDKIRSFTGVDKEYWFAYNILVENNRLSEVEIKTCKGGLKNCHIGDLITHKLYLFSKELESELNSEEMNYNNAFNEISEWLNSQKKDLKTGLKIHAKYSKNEKKSIKLAKTVINKGKLLETYMNELLASISIKVSKQPSENEKPLKRVFVQTFQERLELEFPKIVFSKLPDTLKLLVYKRFDAWEKSKEYYELQQSAQTDEERFEAAKLTILAIMENWSIWKELDHYHVTGQILGKHPDLQKNEFDELIKETEQLSQIESTKEFQKIRKYARNNIGRMLSIAKEKPLTEEQSEIMEVWKYKHDIVSKKINMPLWDDNTD